MVISVQLMIRETHRYQRGAAIVDAVYDDTIDTLEIMLGEMRRMRLLAIFLLIAWRSVGNGVTFTPRIQVAQFQRRLQLLVYERYL